MKQVQVPPSWKSFEMVSCNMFDCGALCLFIYWKNVEVSFWRWRVKLVHFTIVNCFNCVLWRLLCLMNFYCSFYRTFLVTLKAVSPLAIFHLKCFLRYQKLNYCMVRRCDKEKSSITLPDRILLDVFNCTTRKNTCRRVLLYWEESVVVFYLTIHLVKIN